MTHELRAYGHTNGIGGRPITEVIQLTANPAALGAERHPMVDFSALASSQFIGSTFATPGYSGGAQVMIFYLPLYLQNTYDYAPVEAGLSMLPFAFPMFLVPKLGTKLSNRFSSKAMLGIALSITTAADVIVALLSAAGVPYLTFAGGMIVAGVGAGLFNTETAKAMHGAIPPERSGMGSGVSATVRFSGLLLSVVGLGAVLGATTVRVFSDVSDALGLSRQAAQDLAKRFVTGEGERLATTAAESLFVKHHDSLRQAFEMGFACTSAVATILAATALLLTYLILPGARSTHQENEQNDAVDVVPGE
jgi:hypothetical protein